MVFKHGKDTAIHASEFDLSAYLNASDPDQSHDLGDTSTYKNESKTFISGLSEGSIALGGIWDPTADVALQAMVQSAAGEPWAVALDGFAVGNKVRVCKARNTKYAAASPVGDVVTYVVTVDADGGIDIGTALQDSIAAETGAASAAGTDHSALTANGGVAQIHMIAFTGTDITVKVQHSTTDASYIDLATFTALTAVGSEQVTVAEGTTVNRWLRATWTGTFSSATFAVTFARR